MKKNTNIDVGKIKIALKTLCQKAAITLDKKTYTLLFEAYQKEKNENSKEVLGQILQNAFFANKIERPICQDTGQAIVFLEIGQDVHIVGGSLNKAINDAIGEAYKENYFRKSINTSILRQNTSDNSPAIIHTEIVDGDKIKISLCLKGGGAENMSRSEMISPSRGKEGILDFVVETVKNASMKACPPLTIGVGIGGNLEKSGINAKKALISNFEQTEFEKEILEKINALNIGSSGKGGTTTALRVNIIEEPCHIASLPVSVALNCHASRHCSAIIADKTEYDFEDYKIEKIQQNDAVKEIFTNDIEAVKNLKTGEKILLTGKIYTARDQAHKRLLASNEKPFEIKNAIIFYAGPCPAKPDEIIGPIGPTTSSRMDDYTQKLLEDGLLATIGKGERSPQILEDIQKYNAVYFTAIGGIASLLSQCVKSSKLIAYEDLGPEAIYELEVEKMPLFVDCGRMIE